MTLVVEKEDEVVKVVVAGVKEATAAVAIVVGVPGVRMSGWVLLDGRKRRKQKKKGCEVGKKEQREQKKLAKTWFLLFSLVRI